MNPLTYIAVPYSHIKAEVMEARFQKVNDLVAKLTMEGEIVICPILMFHPVAVKHDLPRDWKFWDKYDRTILASCTKMKVLCLDGWKESVGVASEVAIANEMGIPIEYVD
jgi:hypothetical protein